MQFRRERGKWCVIGPEIRARVEAGIPLRCLCTRAGAADSGRHVLSLDEQSPQPSGKPRVFTRVFTHDRLARIS